MQIKFKLSRNNGQVNQKCYKNSKIILLNIKE